MKPEYGDHFDFNESPGEKKLYYALKEQLSNDYLVFHSVKFAAKSPKYKGGKYTENERFLMDKEIDFIIVHPKRGILCIEVKSGAIIFKDHIVCQKSIGSKSDGENGCPNGFNEIKPLEQIVPPKHALIELLSDKYPKDMKSYVVLSAVWFTSVGKKERDGDLPQNYSRKLGRTFFKEDIDNIEETLEKAFDLQAPFVKPKTSEEIEKLMPIVKRYLNPVCRLIPVLSQRFEDANIQFKKMTNDQMLTLQMLDEHRIAVINGLAGSGKTLMAIEKAKSLVDIHPERKVLFLCYNKIIKDHVKEVLNTQNYNVEVMNIYNLCTEYLNTNDIYDSTIHQLLNDIFTGEKAWKYDDVIIDEAQDYSRIVIDLLYKINEKHGGHFYIFYDTYQLTHYEDYNTPDKWISDEWLNQIAPPIKLHKNCRNTIEISDASCKLVGEENRQTIREVTGTKPTWVVNQDEEELEQKLNSHIKYYIDQDIDVSQIVILSLKAMYDPARVLKNRHKNMKLGGYPVSQYKKENHILFTTTRKFKGNESDIVIIVDVEEPTITNDINKRLLYIALSRARHVVEIHVLLENEKGVDKNTFESMKKRELAMKLGMES